MCMLHSLKHWSCWRMYDFDWFCKTQGRSMEWHVHGVNLLATVVFLASCHLSQYMSHYNICLVPDHSDDAIWTSAECEVATCHRQAHLFVSHLSTDKNWLQADRKVGQHMAALSAVLGWYQSVNFKPWTLESMFWYSRNMKQPHVPAKHGARFGTRFLTSCRDHHKSLTDRKMPRQGLAANRRLTWVGNLMVINTVETHRRKWNLTNWNRGWPRRQF